MLLTYSSNSYSVFVVAASTVGQFPAEQLNLFPVELMLFVQYDAAEYSANKVNCCKTSAETSAVVSISLPLANILHTSRHMSHGCGSSQCS